MLKKRKKMYIRTFLLLTLLFSLLECSTLHVYAAGSWVPEVNDSLEGVSDSSNMTERDVWDKKTVPWKRQKAGEDGTLVETGEDINWLDGALGRVLASVGSSLEFYLGIANVTANTVLFGKLAGSKMVLENNAGGVEPAQLFAFSLDSGNPYGYAGAVVYAVLRAIMCAFVGVMVMWQLAKAGISITGQDKSLMKEAFYSGVICIAMLFFMPNVVDLIVYIKDSLLVLVNKGLYEKNMSISLTQNMWNNFVKYSGFLNGLLYSAAVIFMFYLMALYIGNAIAMAALFAFFPFIAFLSITDKGTFSNWLKQVIGTIMVPVIDSVLFVVPAYLCGLNGMFGSIICLISCLFIVPARQALKQALGFGGAGFGEAAGLGALRMMGKATAGALKGGAELAKGLKESSDARKEMRDKAQSEIADDEEKAKLEDSMAKSSTDMNHNTALKEDAFKPNEQKKQAEVDADNIKPGTEGPGENISEKSSSENNPTGESLQDDTITGSSETASIPEYDGGNPSGEIDGGTGGGTESEIMGVPENVQSDGSPIQSDGSQIQSDGLTTNAELTSGDANINLNDDNARMQNLEDMSQAQDEIQAQENEISTLDNTDRAIAAQDEARRNEINDIEQSLATEKAQYLKDHPDAKQSDLNKEFFRKDQQAKIDIANKKAFMGTLTDDKGNVVATSAGVAQKRNEANAKIREQRNVQQNARELEGRFAEADKLNGGSGKTFSDPNEFAMQQNQNEVLRSMANHRNFETPEINAALTHAEQSQYYKARALQKKQDLAHDLQKSYKNDRQAIARAVASGLGAAVGGSLAVMTGEEGVQMGAKIGSSAASFAVNSAQYGQAYVQNGDRAANKWSKEVEKRTQHETTQKSLVESSQEHAVKAQEYITKANASQGIKKQIYKGMNKIENAGIQANNIRSGANQAKDFVSRDFARNVGAKVLGDKMPNMKTNEQRYEERVDKQYHKEHLADVDSGLSTSKNPTMLKGTTPLKRETVAYDPTKLRHIVQDGYKQPKTTDIQIDEKKEEPIVNPEHERAKEVEKMYDEQNRQQGGKKWTKQQTSKSSDVDVDDDYEDDEK